LHDSTIPYLLNFTAEAKAHDFLQINQKAGKPLAGWDEFFGKMVKEDGKVHPERGFHTYYRVDDVRDLTVVLATFLDPKAPKTAKGKDQPYFVLHSIGTAGKTFYIGSGEMWRLRTFKEEYHQVFWQNLIRYVSARSGGKSVGTFQMPRKFELGSVAIEAEVRDKDGMPLDYKIYKDLKVTIKRVDKEAPKDVKEEKVSLRPKRTAGKPDGIFVGTAEITTEGEYELRIGIPDSSDSITKKIEVSRKKGIEKADLSTDFLKLQMLASEPTAEMRKRLQERTTPKQARGDDGGPPLGWSSTRLYFPLPLAEMTTECLERSPPASDTRKGNREDIWNLGPLVYKEQSWSDVPWLYALMFAIPGGVLLITAVVMAFARRWVAVMGLLVTLAAVEIGMFALTSEFTPARLFNPSILLVLFVVPSLIALVAAGILLLAERYYWVAGVIGGLVLYLAGLGIVCAIYYTPDWYLLTGLPVDFVWLLILIGLLLSLEWFTRKMLRLA
jgi:hypothetical protein